MKVLLISNFLIKVKKLDGKELKNQKEFIKSSSIQSEIKYRHNSMTKENITDKDMEQFKSNNFSELTELNLTPDRPPTQMTKSKYIQLIKLLNQNDFWMNKKAKPSFQIKLFENNIKRVNKFKFEIRKKLNKENLLIIIHNKTVMMNLFRTIQLSEKVEPNEFMEFLKISGLINPKIETSFYKSKNELKGKEKLKDNLKIELQSIINGYFIETWMKKNNIFDEKDDQIIAIIKERLKQIEDNSEIQGNGQIHRFESNQNISVETKGNWSYCFNNRKDTSLEQKYEDIWKDNDKING